MASSGGSGPPPTCTDVDQFKNTTDLRCNGLKKTSAGDASQTACLDACCADAGCSVYQWKAGSDHGDGCWMGFCSSELSKGEGWIGGDRGNAPGPTPAPPAAKTSGPLSESFDDSTWDLIDVPHDFIIGGAYNQSTPGSGSSYLPRFDSYYRKHFLIPSDMKGKAIWLEFEGVFQHSEMYLNGVFVGSDDSPGYSSFSRRLDNCSAIKYGERNVLAMFVDGQKGSGWWYEGAGIYRHVYMVATSQTHIDQNGVFAPAKINSIVRPAASTDNLTGPAAGLTADATVFASAAVVSDATDVELRTIAAVTVTFKLFDGNIEVARGSSAALAIDGHNGSPAVHNASLSVSSAKLWSVGSPFLYTLVSTVLDDNGKELDTVNTSIGIRSLKCKLSASCMNNACCISSDHRKRLETDTGNGGMFVNSEHVKVRGFCDHESWGGVGMAVPDRVALFRAQASRSVGGNGRRS
eukprot:SAG31_NODE_8198_length_1498_cov_1.484632_1_plen_463_part_01